MTENSTNDFNAERERLEIEKQKLELEKQKLEFEKEKLQSQKENSIEPIKSKGINVVAIVLGIISILTVFLPWVKGNSSGSASVLGHDYSSSFSSGAISGIVAGEGMLALVLLVVGIILNFKGNRISFAFGAAAFLLTIVFYMRMQSAGTTVSGYGVSGSFRMNVQEGWIASLISTLLYSLFSAFSVTQRKGTSKGVNVSKQVGMNLLFILLSIIALAFISERYFVVALLLMVGMWFLFHKNNYHLSKIAVLIAIVSLFVHALFRSWLFSNTESQILSSLRYEFDNNGYETFEMLILILFSIALILDMFLAWKQPAKQTELVSNKKIKLAAIILIICIIVWPAINSFAFLSKCHSVTDDEKINAKKKLEKNIGMGDWYFFALPNGTQYLPSHSWIAFKNSNGDERYYGDEKMEAKEGYADIYGNISMAIHLNLDSLNQFGIPNYSSDPNDLLNSASFDKEINFSYKDTTLNFPIQFHVNYGSGATADLEITSLSNDTIYCAFNFVEDNSKRHEFKLIGISKLKFDELTKAAGNEAKISDQIIFKDLKLPLISTGNILVDNKLKNHIIYLGESIGNRKAEPEKVSGLEGTYSVNYNANGIISITFYSNNEECNFATYSLRTGEPLKANEIFKQESLANILFKCDSIFQSSAQKLKEKYNGNEDSLRVCYSDGTLEGYRFSETNFESFVILKDGLILKDVVCFSNIKDKIEIKIPFADLKEYVNPNGALSFILNQ